MNTAYLNGQYIPLSQAKVSVLDRGFMFSDGVYDIIPCYQGKLFRREEHLQRLQRNLDALKINSEKSFGEWIEIIERLIEKNGVGNYHIYIQVTRGADSIRSNSYPPDLPATLFVMCQPMSVDLQELDAVTGMHVIVLEDTRWERCDIKSIGLLPNVLLTREAREAGADEAILVREKQLTEGASSNVFVVNSNEIVTPPLSHRLLGGITRKLVIELCQQAEMNIQERTVMIDELYEAGEVWMTSSTMGILPVTKIGKSVVNNGHPGPKWRKLAARYIEYRATLQGTTFPEGQ